jgi:hypothetical protein
MLGATKRLGISAGHISIGAVLVRLSGIARDGRYRRRMHRINVRKCDSALAHEIADGIVGVAVGAGTVWRPVFDVS